MNRMKTAIMGCTENERNLALVQNTKNFEKMYFHYFYKFFIYISMQKINNYETKTSLQNSDHWFETILKQEKLKFSF